MSKVSNKHMKTLLDGGYITIDKYNEAIADGKATDITRNKLNLLREMEGFNEIEQQLNTWVSLNRREIEETFDRYNDK